METGLGALEHTGDEGEWMHDFDLVHRRNG
jgi:hypothetical protein